MTDGQFQGIIYGDNTYRCPAHNNVKQGSAFTYAIKSSSFGDNYEKPQGAPFKKFTNPTTVSHVADSYVYDTKLLTMPSSYMLFVDSVFISQSGTGGNTGNQKNQAYLLTFQADQQSGVHFRHAGRANVAFMDGHVDGYTVGNMKSLFVGATSLAHEPKLYRAQDFDTIAY